MIELLDDLCKDAVNTIIKHKNVRVVSHHDADGITAAGIISSALLRRGIQFHTSIISRLTQEFLDEIYDEMVIFCDMGSSQPDQLAELESEIVVLDHHTIQGDHSSHVHVNPHLVGIHGSFDLSASGVAYGVARQMGDNVDLSGLAITGAIGDRQRMSSANGDILKEGVEHGVITIKQGLNIGEGDLHELLEFTTDPYLDISGDSDKVDAFLRKLSIEGTLGGLSLEDSKRLNSAILLKLLKQTPTDVINSLIGDVYVLNREVEKNALNMVRMLNSAGKLKKTGIALSICLRDDSGINEAHELYIYLQKKLISELKKAEKNIKEGKNIRYLFTDDDDVPSAMSSVLIRHVFTDKPLIVICPMQSFSKASGRGTMDLISKGLDLSVAMQKAAEAVGGRGGGHNIASGASVPKDMGDEFIRIVDMVVGKQLN
ncbi:MAG: DHH family phosphoesterase [Halobacteriota archaeon]|nr:DHH family phosphoesterase [Halobacteriota archaeon]